MRKDHRKKYDKIQQIRSERWEAEDYGTRSERHSTLLWFLWARSRTRLESARYDSPERIADWLRKYGPRSKYGHKHAAPQPFVRVVC